MIAAVTPADDKLARAIRTLENEARECIARNGWGKFSVTIRDGKPVLYAADLTRPL